MELFNCQTTGKLKEKNVEDKEASLFEIYKNNEVFCAEAQNEGACKKAPNL